MKMHRLLERQLKKHIIPQTDSSAFEPFLESINQAYFQYEDDRLLLEQSLELTSDELLEKNSLLQGKLTEIEQMSSMFQLLFEKAPAGMAIVTQDDNFEIVNSAFTNLTGFTNSELQHIKFKGLSNKNDLASLSELIDDLLISKIEFFKCEIKFKQKSKKNIDILLHAGLLKGKNDHPNRIIFQLVDISKRKEAEELLQYHAHHDFLTGLHNRKCFFQILESAMNKARQDNNYHFAVLFFDLDRFKVINDSMGHLAGDQLLKQLADRMLDAVSSKDIVARLGGDEFIILLDNLPSPEYVITRASVFQLIFKEPFLIHGKEIYSDASIGIALSSPEYNTPEEMLRDADIAMYRAKSEGKSRVSVFDKKMHSDAVVLLEIETILRKIIACRDLDVFYQPIVSIKKNQITGCEALLRFKGEHFSSNQYNLETIIEVAEQSGLINYIGEYVLNEATKFACQIQNNGFPEFRISVNVSPQQLNHKRFSSQVEQILQKNPVSKDSLVLELTEGIMMESGIETVSKLNELKKLNLQLSIDDFGTGFSSLSYLQKFPIDFLKVDRSFLNGVPDDEGDAAITSAVITLGHILGLKVVAEGIENSVQLDFIRSLDCDYYQGYYKSRPLPAQDFLNLLNN